MVQLMASAHGRPLGRAGRGAGALAEELATAGAVGGDGSRAGRETIHLGLDLLGIAVVEEMSGCEA